MMKLNGAIAFVKGVGFKNVRPAFYAWFFNFVFSLFVYWGYYRLFVNAAGDSVIAENIESQTAVFTFLADIAFNHDGGLSMVSWLAVLAALLYFTISIFLAGGIYGTLVGDERTSFMNMLACSIENFFSMILLFVINLLHTIVALIVPVILFLIFVNSDSMTNSESAINIFTYGFSVLLAVVLLFCLSVYDFSRIFKLKDDKSVFNAYKKGLLFTLRNKFSFVVLMVLYALSIWILYLFFTLFTSLAGEFLYVLILFLFYQGFLLTRYFLKITVMSAEVNLTSVEQR